MQTNEQNSETVNPGLMQTCFEEVQTRVFFSGGRWVLQFRSSIMSAPALWRYPSEQEAKNAEGRLNPRPKPEERIM